MNLNNYLDDCRCNYSLCWNRIKKLVKSINDNLPIYSVKGYSITINHLYETKMQKLLLSFVSNDRLRIVGTAEVMWI